jgi:hypothetical protein
VEDRVYLKQQGFDFSCESQPHGLVIDIPIAVDDEVAEVDDLSSVRELNRNVRKIATKLSHHLTDVR